MKKTSIYLLAALAATTAMGKANANYRGEDLGNAIPSYAEITGASIPNFGLRTNGTTFSSSSLRAQAAQSRDPRCRQVLQQIQVNKQYLTRLDLSDPWHRRVAEKVRYAIQVNRDWYNRNCQ